MVAVFFRALLLRALLAVAPVPALAQAPIGIDAGLKPQAVATRPSEGPRLLTVGEPIVFNERIATSENGETQILFLDQSTVSIGPSSELVIDQFLFDPKASAGRLAMSTTRGVFRFIGGKVSKLEAPVILDTPCGTIGIRGGIFLASLSADGVLNVVFVYGKELTVTGRNGVITRVRRPGFAVSVGGFDQSPSAPYQAPPGLIGGLLGQLQGPPPSQTQPPAPPTSLAGITDAKVAAQPLFGLLAGDPQAANRNPPPPPVPVLGLPPPPPQSLLGTLAGGRTLGIGSVAPQGDVGLQQATK